MENLWKVFPVGYNGNFMEGFSRQKMENLWKVFPVGYNGSFMEGFSSGIYEREREREERE